MPGAQRCRSPGARPQAYARPSGGPSALAPKASAGSAPAPSARATRLAWEAYGPLGEMGYPMIEKMSDKALETLIRFLRGGTQINEERAQQLLEGG